MLLKTCKSHVKKAKILSVIFHTQTIRFNLYKDGRSRCAIIHCNIKSLNLSKTRIEFMRLLQWNNYMVLVNLNCWLLSLSLSESNVNYNQESQNKSYPRRTQGNRSNLSNDGRCSVCYNFLGCMYTTMSEKRALVSERFLAFNALVRSAGVRNQMSAETWSVAERFRT